ncbi:PaiB family negative transcriptional regulator [Prauserella shujinwangii]|uniref:PaiB family negative transcriptional regulator n=1 Tax=Prauserella shujinwangii TaxID=1453103 RepID=A0A2T0LMA4_9PSEU|nr:FMN-binding negative transcriptional regulator [Prauserella shujinwangii]PRX44170.1 PaiB family negative transcriptional regulator [Prauserella shujinwangii]
MLIHPWDAATGADEWVTFLRQHDFGELVASGRRRELPVVQPAHYAFDARDGGHTVWLHLARPNPVWPLLAENPRALFAVTGDYAYVPADWNAAPGGDPALGVPTSYYASVQLECTARVIDDPDEKADLLNRMLARFETAGTRVPVRPGAEPDRRLLPAIRGVELTVTGVRAKFKFGGNKDADHRAAIAGRLAGRDGPGDRGARHHLLRRTPDATG